MLPHDVGNISTPQLPFLAVSNVCLFTISLTPFFLSFIYISTLVRFLSVSFASIMSCTGQILQVVFHHTLSQKFQLSLPNSKYKCLFFISINSHESHILFIVFSVRFCRTAFLSPRVSSLTVRNLSSIHCHIGRLMVLSISVLFSLFYMKLFYFL